MQGKSAITSKTLWLNILAIIAILVQNFTNSFVFSPEDQVAILGVINLILRIITKQPIVWSKE